MNSNIMTAAIVMVVICLGISGSLWGVSMHDGKCVHFKNSSSNMVVERNSNVTFTFSIQDRCLRDLNVVQINKAVQTSKAALHCYFFHDNSACTASGWPEACSCDRNLKEYIVQDHVSEESWIEWVIQGRTTTHNVSFHASFNILVRDPPVIRSLEAIDIDGAIDNSSITVVEHSSLTLQCFWHEGNPPKTAMLVKNGFHLPLSEQPYISKDRLRHLKYVINDVRCWHDGIFSCVTEGAHNRSIRLHVPCEETTQSQSTTTSSVWGATASETPLRQFHTTEEPLITKSTATTLYKGVEALSTVDHTLVLYSSIGCVFLIVVVVSVVFGILFKRKVLTSKAQQSDAYVEREAVELPQLPVDNEISGSRDSVMTSASHIYEEIKEENIKSTKRRGRLLEKNREGQLADLPDDYLRPIASAREKSTPATQRDAGSGRHSSKNVRDKQSSSRQRCNPSFVCPTLETNSDSAASLDWHRASLPEKGGPAVLQVIAETHTEDGAERSVDRNMCVICGGDHSQGLCLGKRNFDFLAGDARGFELSSDTATSTTSGNSGSYHPPLPKKRMNDDINILPNKPKNLKPQKKSSIASPPSIDNNQFGSSSSKGFDFELLQNTATMIKEKKPAFPSSTRVQPGRSGQGTNKAVDINHKDDTVESELSLHAVSSSSTESTDSAGYMKPRPLQVIDRMDKTERAFPSAVGLSSGSGGHLAGDSTCSSKEREASTTLSAVSSLVLASPSLGKSQPDDGGYKTQTPTRRKPVALPRQLSRREDGVNDKEEGSMRINKSKSGKVKNISEDQIIPPGLLQFPGDAKAMVQAFQGIPVFGIEGRHGDDLRGVGGLNGPAAVSTSADKQCLSLFDRVPGYQQDRTTQPQPAAAEKTSAYPCDVPFYENFG